MSPRMQSVNPPGIPHRFCIKTFGGFFCPAGLPYKQRGLLSTLNMLSNQMYMEQLVFYAVLKSKKPEEIKVANWNINDTLTLLGTKSLLF